jgi:hypothetical protein
MSCFYERRPSTMIREIADRMEGYPAEIRWTHCANSGHHG